MLLRCALTALVVLGFVGSASAADPTYTKDIKPFLNKYCMECHRGDKAKGGLDMSSYKTISKGGNTGDAIVAQKPDESKLLTLMDGTSKPKMPPRKAKLQPTAKEIEMVRAWIKAGAKDDSNGKTMLPLDRNRPENAWVRFLELADFACDF